MTKDGIKLNGGKAHLVPIDRTLMQKCRQAHTQYIAALEAEKEKELKEKKEMEKLKREREEQER